MHNLQMTLVSIYARKREHLSSKQSMDAREQALHALVQDYTHIQT